MPITIYNTGGDVNGDCGYMLVCGRDRHDIPVARKGDLIVSFSHHRPDGLVACLRMAADAVDKMLKHEKAELDAHRKRL